MHAILGVDSGSQNEQASLVGAWDLRPGLCPPCSCVFHGEVLECLVRLEQWAGVSSVWHRWKGADGLGLAAALVCFSTLTPGTVLMPSGSSWSGDRNEC